MKKEIKKFTVSDPEYYFIQFLFMDNRSLLGYGYKELYKAMLDAYSEIYEMGRESKVDLSDINKKFKASL